MTRESRPITPFLAILISLSALAPRAPASDCTKTSVGLVPLSDLKTGEYKGRQGGLYPGGINARPPAHEQAGLDHAGLMRPLDASGQPSAGGKIVLLSVGMSNTTQEFSTFKPMADADPDKNPNLTIVDGAQGGMTASIITNPNATGYQQFWSTVDSRLRSAGVTGAQVQVAWVKEADAGPSAAFPNDALILKSELAEIARILKSRFPNMRIAYYSSRIYAGYASTALNPEPFAYQSGFAVKWLIEDQINGAPDLNFDAERGAVRAPWLAWGPYLWADGLTARSDGLNYVCSDFADDGTHPAAGGARNKVARLLLDFLKTDSTAKGWFLRSGSVGSSTLAFPILVAAVDGSASAPSLSSGFALANVTGSSTTLTFTATAADGSVVSGAGISNPASLPLAAGAQLARMDQQIFGSGIASLRSPAWVRADSSLSRLTGFFLLFNRDLSVLDGAPSFSRSYNSWVFPEISRRGLMQIHVVNGNAEPATVTLQLLQADGNTRGSTVQRSIRPAGVLAASLSELFPGVAFAESDYLRAISTLGVYPLELFGAPEAHIASLNGQDAISGTTSLLCPQYATGGGWGSRLSVVNLDGAAGLVRFEYLDDSGVAKAPPRVLPVAARGKLNVSDPAFFLDAGPSLSQGYVRISGGGLRLAGSVVFSDPELEVFAAALPLLAQMESSAVLSQVASGKSWFTGIALLNAGDLTASVSLEAFDASGTFLAGSKQNLAPHQRRSLLVTQFFPSLQGKELSSGYIRMISDRPVGLFAVYGTPELTALSAIPAQPVP